MDNISSIVFFTLLGINESRTTKYIIFAFSLPGFSLTLFFNLILISIIYLERELHEPMYIFLCSLCINGLCGAAGFFPKFLSDLLTDSNVISFSWCVFQNAFIFMYSLREFTNLTVMALDRYIAVCRPLHYHTIMTPVVTGKLLVLIWMFPFCSVALSVALTVTQPLCGSNIQRIFCQNWYVERLACKKELYIDVINGIFSFCVVSMITCVFISYFKIILACITSKSKQHKFMQTVLPHMITFSIFVVVTIFEGLEISSGDDALSKGFEIMFSVNYLIIPPFFNPIIYGLNLNPIRTQFKKIFLRNKLL